MNEYDWKWLILMTSITGFSLILTVNIFGYAYPSIPMLLINMVTGIIGGLIFFLDLIAYVKILKMREFYEERNDSEPLERYDEHEKEDETIDE